MDVFALIVGVSSIKTDKRGTHIQGQTLLGIIYVFYKPLPHSPFFLTLLTIPLSDACVWAQMRMFVIAGLPALQT